MHGGDQEVAAPGHPIRGGAPERHGLYSRHLKPEQREAFTLAKLGSLDDEIRLAKAKLDWAVKRWAQDEDGGVVVSPVFVEGEHVGDRIRPWSEIVGEWGERVRRLELARRQLLEGAGGEGRGALRSLIEQLRGAGDGA